mmetsp:Transcript_9729/g.14663  ORF Transcript_9729/g.14663 Transcript_9729/m.14663 type:complete len:227 (+) Transcript_9729:123-803(+)|eukprot:CAMPEP_0185030734 /NCGR_PEP_ID=MMETSP1103-20130426/17769_1 /TAXON_ID=36769 /ORGANISM="Paraphysomonas bandaiensis, Strain Caron Lab Isolate" /LENGTH=226 /DNA_ID=CAMNT_0027565965 /DNA_START=40 /DNA_END=720 /DNA_ORIENTATION=+
MEFSREEALQTVCSMFESWDRETVAAILDISGYNVEVAIDTIISMNQPQKQGSSSCDDQIDSIGVSESIGRKRVCTYSLPHDFLQAPARDLNRHNRKDDKQNDLIYLDEDQALDPMSGEYNFWESTTDQRVEQNERIPDMGILKAINDLGEGMRSQIQVLTLKLSSSIGHTGTQEEQVNLNTFPMTVHGYEEEEEEEEIPLMSSMTAFSASNISYGQPVGVGKKNK